MSEAIGYLRLPNLKTRALFQKLVYNRLINTDLISKICLVLVKIKMYSHYTPIHRQPDIVIY